MQYDTTANAWLIHCVDLQFYHMSKGLPVPSLTHASMSPCTQAEFTPLAEWVRERTLFDLISCIGFFRNYLTGRCFRRWHKVRISDGTRSHGTRSTSVSMHAQPFAPNSIQATTSIVGMHTPY